MGSSGGIGIIRARHGGSWVYSRAPGRSLGSLHRTLEVVEFILVGWVQSRAPSLSISVVVGFTRVRPVGRWVHPGLFGSLTRALWVVGFIQGIWFYSRAPLVSRRSFGDVGFARARPGCR